MCIRDRLSVCDQSEFGAALGVARLAMNVDDNINNKDNTIKEIKIINQYEPNLEKNDILLKRYSIWKDLYTSNKVLAPNLLS